MKKVDDSQDDKTPAGNVSVKECFLYSQDPEKINTSEMESAPGSSAVPEAAYDYKQDYLSDIFHPPRV